MRKVSMSLPPSLILLFSCVSVFAQPGDLLSAAAKAAFEKQNFAPCIAEMSKIILTQPKNATALVERARCLFLSADDTNDEKVMLAEISKTILDKNKAETAVNVEVMSRRNKAVDDATKAIAINPKNANAFNIRGLVKSSLGTKERAEALADFEKAIEIEPKFIKPYFNRGTARADASDYDGAIADFTKVIVLDPNNVPAINYLAQLKEVIATKTPDTTSSNNCVSGNCVNGFGKMVYTNGDIYEGGFVNGKKEGLGSHTFKNGQVYLGQFYDNLRNGNGKFTFSDGNIYEGRFINDNFIGQGTYTNKSGRNLTGKFAVGQIVDLQSRFVNTYWGKAEIIEILGDKYKIRNLIDTSIEIVSEKQLRPFTPPDKYEIGQKVEVMDKGIWYIGEIIGNEVEYNDHYRIRFEGTSNRSDLSESVRFIRPLTSSSTAQTKQEYSSPLWVEKFGISEPLLTKKMLTEANNLYEGCVAKYNTLIPPTKLETPSSRSFADQAGSFGEENRILLTYAIGNANLTRIKGTNLKTSRVGYTEPQLLVKRQETDEIGNKINLNVIPLVFRGSDSYQIEAEPNNDDYTGFIKFVCNATKSSAATAKLTVFNSTTNGSSGVNTASSDVPTVPSSNNNPLQAQRREQAINAYRIAIGEYNRAMRSYDDAAAKLLRNKGATDLMPGTMARLQREPINAKKALTDMMDQHGAYLPENMASQVRQLIVKAENVLR